MVCFLYSLLQIINGIYVIINVCNNDTKVIGEPQTIEQSNVLIINYYYTEIKCAINVN